MACRSHDNTASACIFATLRAAILMLLAACAADPPSPPAKATAPTSPSGTLDQAPTGRLSVVSREYPWSAIGRLNLGGRGYCTGTLVGPQQVLVRASCLYDVAQGRWRARSELYFLAGYQSDRRVAGAAIQEFHVAVGYDPAAGTSLANLVRNWALVALEVPIGSAAGWLAVSWQAARDRDQPLLLAGYRRDREHSVTLFYGCEAASGPDCRALPGERRLPTLVIDGGTLRVAGERYFPSPEIMVEALGKMPAGDADLSGRPPSLGAVDPAPTTTVGALLAQLGYLDQGSPENRSGPKLTEAIRTYERAKGLAETGEVSIALMSRLIADARRSAGLRVSQDEP